MCAQNVYKNNIYKKYVVGEHRGQTCSAALLYHTLREMCLCGVVWDITTSWRDSLPVLAKDLWSTEAAPYHNSCGEHK